MHQIKATFLVIWYLSFLFLSTSLYASMEISGYKLFYATDKQTKTLMPSSYTVASDTTKVWVSSEIKDAPPQTKVIFKWYYIKDKKSKKIYEKTMESRSSATIESYFKWNNRDFFVSGNYRVDVYLGDEMVKSLYFTISSLQSTKHSPAPECIKPTITDDKLLISDALKNYPMMQGKLDILKLKRYYGKGDEFSTLVPSAWEINENRSSAVLLSISNRSKQNHKSRLLLMKLPLDAVKTSIKGSDTIIQTTIRLMIGMTSSTNKKIVSLPKFTNLPNMMIGRYEVLYTKKEKKSWKNHTVIYDGRYLYNFVLWTEDEEPDFRGFLSALLVYTFWTKESCN